jgi:hypothetical protein
VYVPVERRKTAGERQAFGKGGYPKNESSSRPEAGGEKKGRNAIIQIAVSFLPDTAAILTVNSVFPLCDA